MKNVDQMLQYLECSMWRLLSTSSNRKEKADIQTLLEDVSFTCGAQPGCLNEVYTMQMSLMAPIFNACITH